MLSIASPVRAKRGSNRYCGPSALSAVTGIDTYHTAALLRHVSGRPAIRGCAVDHMLVALHRLGLRVDMIASFSYLPSRQRPTLQAWARDSEYRRRNDVILCVAGDHYVLLQGDRYVCGISKDVVPLAEAPYRRHKLSSAFRLTRAKPQPDIKALLPKPRRKTAEEKRAASDATFARRLARAHGIEIEVEGGRIVVWGPAFLPEIDEEVCDPFYGDHTAEGWPDALKMVREYARLKETKPHWFES